MSKFHIFGPLFLNTTFSYYLNDGSGRLEDFLNVSVMDHVKQWLGAYRGSTNGYSPRWNGETGSCVGDGCKNLSDKYIGGYLWLDKLGLLSQADIDLVIRQTFVGAGGANVWGNYSLLSMPDNLPNTVKKKLNK